MRVLALIPARSGSRGLEDKNIRRVGGVPMLARAVHLAAASARRGESWRIVASTDSSRYAEIARRAGAEVPFLRPRRLATSRARLIDAVLHTVERLERRGDCFDAVVMLSAATPLTLPLDVRRALRLFRRSGVSVVSVVKDRTPDAWRFTLDGGALCAPGPVRVGRRQEGEPRYRLNGAIYVAAPAWLEENRQFLVAGRSLGLVMPRERSVDVEDELDLALARLLWDRRRKSGGKRI